MISAGYITQKTFLHRLDARTKLALLMAILVLALVFSHPLYVLALLALVLAAWTAARLPMEFLKSVVKYFSGIALLIFALQVFFYPGKTPILRLSNPIPVIGFSGSISLEGILFGTAMVLRLVVIMAVAPLLIMTTPLSELMLALVKLRVPDRFAFILTTAMSLLPSIQNRAFLIQQAQLCRGVGDFETGNFFVRLRASASLLVPLILGAFRDSQTLDVAISSRAFGAPVKRVYLLESRLKTADYILLVLAALGLLLGILLRAYHLGGI